MLDVHVLRSPTTQASHAELCHRTIAFALLGIQGVHVHVVPAIDGHIGLARCDGFRQGWQPYVTFIDEDDWVAPSFFSTILQRLPGLDAMFLAEMMETPNGRSIPRTARHCRAVYRREMLDGFDWHEWPVYTEVALRLHAQAKATRVADLDAPLYHWRYDPRSPAKQLAERYPDLTATIRDRLHGQSAEQSEPMA